MPAALLKFLSFPCTFSSSQLSGASCCSWDHAGEYRLSRHFRPLRQLLCWTAWEIPWFDRT